MSGTIYPTEYATPVLRAPSPTSSIGTVYQQDQTSWSDSELTQHEFEAKWEELIGLKEPTAEEDLAGEDPLLPRPLPEPHSIEESQLHENIVRNLRQRVQELVDAEMFEQALLRGSRVGLEQPTSSEDIGAIMQSMMPMSISNLSYTAVQDGPWNNKNEYLHGRGSTLDMFPGSEGTVGKSPRKKSFRKP